jgi:hypothetical protein
MNRLGLVLSIALPLGLGALALHAYGTGDVRFAGLVGGLAIWSLSPLARYVAQQFFSVQLPRRSSTPSGRQLALSAVLGVLFAFLSLSLAGGFLSGLLAAAALYAAWPFMAWAVNERDRLINGG